jgi:hypothetical protein
MKAIEAPEKIYIDISLDSDWGMSKRSYDNEVEYTRTDAFIEKAVWWLSKHFYDEEYQSKDNEGTWICADEMIEDFKKYMEGE